MKLVIAIVQDLDEAILSEHLLEHDFRITKLKTSGGFLQKGNATMLMGVEDERLDECIKIIEENCETRKSKTTFVNPGLDMAYIQSLPMEINVGGATIFIIDVDRFIRI